MPLIILDPGHGGNDIGDFYGNRFSKDDNLRLALAVGERLVNYGIPVVYTRTSDVYVSEIERASIARRNMPDLFISFHRIIGDIPRDQPGLGFFINTQGGIAEYVSENIAEELSEIGFAYYFIDVRTDFYVCRAVNIPFVSIVIGYLNSDEDNLLFDTRLDEIADAIAKGIVKTFDIQMTYDYYPGYIHYAENQPHYRIQVGLFAIYDNAVNLQQSLLERGFQADIIQRGELYSVQVGDFTNLDDAAELERSLRIQGYNTFLISV